MTIAGIERFMVSVVTCWLCDLADVGVPVTVGTYRSAASAAWAPYAGA